MSNDKYETKFCAGEKCKVKNGALKLPNKFKPKWSQKVALLDLKTPILPSVMTVNGKSAVA